jgi:Competence protein CoiA-like family
LRTSRTQINWRRYGGKGVLEVHEAPARANKDNAYTCPGCERDVIFRRGDKNVAHFAHKSSADPCRYFDRPSESHIHKDAKLKLKHLLEKVQHCHIERECDNCSRSHLLASIDRSFSGDDGEVPFELDFYMNDCSMENVNVTTVKVVLEHRFQHMGSTRIADVAILVNDDLKVIFEICHRHKTKEKDRPEPWFEFDAQSIIESFHEEEDEMTMRMDVNCIRKHPCPCVKEISGLRNVYCCCCRK